MINLIVFLLLLVTADSAATQDVDACACLNGGIFDGNRCVCPNGYVGLYCQQEVEATEMYMPCNSTCNNGYCDYTCGMCVCHPFYTGEHCERPLIVSCGDYYCFNEGVCQEDASGKEHCHCSQGYSGEYCLFSNETCYCLNGGTCDTAQNITTCTCPDGFTGEHCETEICTPECSTNAYCCNGTCQCYPGYTGDDCTEVDGDVLPWTRCGDYFCFNGGTCQNGTCQCSEGFGGDYCLYSDCGNSTDNGALETCGAHVCYYGGMCVNDTCQCPNNTFGVYCEYVKAPSDKPSLMLDNVRATSATLQWDLPAGYETIASSGGVWYTITVENMVTGQKHTVRADSTMQSYRMIQNTKYCFTVRAEVSGGSGYYSEQNCTTTPGHDSCFCHNGGYNSNTRECDCHSGYYGTYCTERMEPAHCPAEAEYNSVLGHTFNWTETTVGQVGHLPCPCKSTLDITRNTYATRACMEGGKWRDTDDGECSVKAVMDLCETKSVCDLLAKVQAAIELQESGGVTAILTSVELLAKETCNGQAETPRTLLDAVEDTLSTSDDVLKMTREKSDAATTLVNTLKEIATRGLEEGTSGSWDSKMGNLAVSASAVRDAMTKNGFNITFSGSARARLSSHLFNDMRCNSTVVTSSVIDAKRRALFGGAVEGEAQERQIVSSILSVTVGNCTISGSTEAIEITFTVPQSAEYSAMGCYYWKTSANNGVGAWSAAGCSKLAEAQRGEVVCSCNHLTTFAVLQGRAESSVTVVYYYAAGGAAAALLFILLIVVIVVAVCCWQRSKDRGAHGFTRETELHIIPGSEDFDGTEKAASYSAIDMSTLNRGNQYDTIHTTPEVNPIYAEIGENQTDANGANLSKEKCSQDAKEGGPGDHYDTADGAMAFSGENEDVAMDNYEPMSVPAAVYSNTATGM